MYEEICYQNNYVREVVCRLDFASPINVLKNTMPKNIYDVVKKYYPIAEPQDIIGTELQINPVNGPAVNQVRTKQWVFLSRNRANKCTIESDNIVFSIQDYNVFEELKCAVFDILGVVMETFPENQGKRLGLRYINNLLLKDHDDWIDDKFFRALSSHKNDKTTKLMTVLEYAIIDKDLSVRLQYGYYNPDYPAIMKKEDFVIDIDAYSTGIIYREDIEQFINDMHYEDQKCFETMITEELRKNMDVGQ